MPGIKEGQPPNFLSGWKDIANYLGKGVRTVQRYEREMRLPVRRPAGKPRASVVATKAELDAWVAAVPFCHGLRLSHAAVAGLVCTDGIKSGVQEMRRLRKEMSELRQEVNAALMMLRENIKTVKSEMSRPLRNSTSISIEDFDPHNKAVAHLIGTRLADNAN